MSDTPDITAFGYDSFESRWIVQLESELYEARKQREEARVIASKYEDRYFETKEQRDRLEEALRELEESRDFWRKAALNPRR